MRLRALTSHRPEGVCSSGPGLATHRPCSHAAWYGLHVGIGNGATARHRVHVAPIRSRSAFQFADDDFAMANA